MLIFLVYFICVYSIDIYILNVLTSFSRILDWSTHTANNPQDCLFHQKSSPWYENRKHLLENDPTLLGSCFVRSSNQRRATSWTSPLDDERSCRAPVKTKNSLLKKRKMNKSTHQQSTKTEVRMMLLCNNYLKTQTKKTTPVCLFDKHWLAMMQQTNCAWRKIGSKQVMQRGQKNHFWFNSV